MSVDQPALRALAGRVLGSAGAHVTFEEMPTDGQRTYAFEAGGGEVVIRGSDTVGAAVGLHRYLQRSLHRRVCWDTPLPLDATILPDVDEESGHVRAADVYSLNFCTFSYTTAYWTWERWEREIDWMALHGVTMPLAAVGHEAVLARVYTELGLTDDEVRQFLGGPGYLPFQFMSCLDGWAGPLPPEWLAERAALGARIIARQRELGMTPVLPAFTGHVPRALAATDSTEREWWGFATTMLSPRDRRFRELGERVVQVQREMFGEGHLYAADPFIEMVPPSGDDEYLVDLATTVVAGLRAADPDAVWVMQAWTFGYLDYWTDDRVAALLDAVPDDAMLLLDLWGEHSPQWRRFGGFRGKRWLWCTLHNFGGRSDAFGNLAAVHDECEAAALAPSPPCGIGLAMEATEQNHVVYELALDLAVASIDDRGEWLAAYARQRYGTAATADAWDRLAATVYEAPRDRLTPDAARGLVTTSPVRVAGFDSTQLAHYADRAVWYDRSRLVDAWRRLLDAAERHPHLLADELGHDLVAVASTCVVRAIDSLTVNVLAAFETGLEAGLDTAVSRLMSAYDDLDDLLSMRPELRLQSWERAAAASALTDAGRAVLIDNARRIITVWDRGDKVPLTDYSARLWSGLVSGYYRERWRAWADGLGRARRNGAPADPSRLAADIATATQRFLSQGADRPAPGAAEPVDQLRALRRALDTYGKLLT